MIILLKRVWDSISSVWRGVFSRYQLGVLQFNFNSDTVYLEIASDSTGKGSVLQESTLPTTLDATHKPRLLSVLGSAGHRQRFLRLPPQVWLICDSSSQNSRETFYLLDHWFIIKECNSGMDRRKRCTGQSMGGGIALPHSCQAYLSPWTSTCSPIHKLSKLHRLYFYGGLITQEWLIKFLDMGDYH